MPVITQTLHHHQQQLSHRQVTLEEACAVERLAHGYRYTYEAPTNTPDLLLTSRRVGEIRVASAPFGTRRVDVAPSERAEQDAQNDRDAAAVRSA